MSSIIDLMNGKYIIVDNDDAKWIRDEGWRWVVRNVNNGNERIFIESILERQRYLHNLFFPNRHSHSKIEFINGDPFDYRRDNLFKTSYYQRKRYSGRAREESVVRSVKGAAVGILENRCVIAPTNIIYRPLLCCTCSYIDEERYMRCLNVAAHGVWVGWEVVQKDRWCEELNQKLEVEKRKEKASGR